MVTWSPLSPARTSQLRIISQYNMQSPRHQRPAGDAFFCSLDESGESRTVSFFITFPWWSIDTRRPDGGSSSVRHGGSSSIRQRYRSSRMGRLTGCQSTGVFALRTILKLIIDRRPSARNSSTADNYITIYVTKECHAIKVKQTLVERWRSSKDLVK